MRISGVSVAAVVLAMLMIGQVYAGIILNTTRVVYAAQNKEASLMVLNNNRSDILLQSWVEPMTDDAQSVPFAVVPPLTRVSAGSRQTVRIIHAGTPMATDRESIYWLNVQEIPQASVDENALQVGIRQRIKLFYRPSRLSMPPEQASAQLQWRVSHDGAFLHVTNPSPYYVTLINIHLEDGHFERLKMDSDMLEPGEDTRYPLSREGSGNQALLNFSSINDYGATVGYRANVKGVEPVLASRVDL